MVGKNETRSRIKLLYKRVRLGYYITLQTVLDVKR